jgi:hypothetical protein
MNFTPGRFSYSGEGNETRLRFGSLCDERLGSGNLQATSATRLFGAISTFADGWVRFGPGKIGKEKDLFWRIGPKCDHKVKNEWGLEECLRETSYQTRVAMRGSTADG